LLASRTFVGVYTGMLAISWLVNFGIVLGSIIPAAAFGAADASIMKELKASTTISSEVAKAVFRLSENLKCKVFLFSFLFSHYLLNNADNRVRVAQYNPLLLCSRSHIFTSRIIFYSNLLFFADVHSEGFYGEP
jgi:hypothetical protein